MTATVVKNFSEISSIISNLKIAAVYLFIGNGKKLQYANMEQVKVSLRPVLTNLDNLHGPQKWMAVYGGDDYDPQNPDLGACMQFIKKEFKPTVISVQSWDSVDDFVDYVYFYEEQFDETGRHVYGGASTSCDNQVKLVGGSSIYLSQDFLSVLSGVVNISAKGRIGTQEIEYAKSVGLNVLEVAPADPRRQP